jgi:hypothetical protein
MSWLPVARMPSAFQLFSTFTPCALVGTAI